MMDFSYKQGDKLLLQLTNNEVYEGVYIGGGTNRIDVTNIKSVSDGGASLQGNLSFYRNEVARVSIITPVSVEKATKSETPILSLTECEYERLKAMTHNYIYLPMVDQKYENALKYLNQQENVSVVGLQTHPGRTSPLDLLVLASWEKVFLFDIKSYTNKMFVKDLRTLFECKYIKKVVFDARALYDCLKYIYKVDMFNFFDVHVADAFIDGTERSKKHLGDLLAEYFQLPSALLHKAERSNYSERPLTDTRKIFASQLAVFLITLKNHQESLLLQDFYEKVESDVKSVVDMSDLDAQKCLRL